MAKDSTPSVITGSTVVSAGLASACAALVTSNFGVAGTILGAALTTMIITGGAALLKSYMETLTGYVRRAPGKMRETRESRKARRYAEPDEPSGLPGRPDLKDNFMGRMRAALDWFRRLPQANRRSILMKSLVAALIAFVIGMGAIFAFEKVIGNSLSCGLWANCPVGAEPGIHPLGLTGTGAGGTVGGGGAPSNAGAPAPGLFNRGANPQDSQNGGVFGQDSPFGGRDAQPSASPDPGASPEPSDPDAAPPGRSASDSSASASPAAEEEASPQPRDASPAPSE